MANLPAAPAGEAHELVNLRGLEQLLTGMRLDALVCRSGMNVTYLSGIGAPGTLGRHLDLAETPRETFVVWPLSGERCVVLSDIASHLARATSRIKQFEVYQDYADSPEAALARVLQSTGLAKARVGFDLAWFSARRWSELLLMVPDLQPVDCTDELDLVRAIKTPAEVEQLRRAASVLDRTFMEVFPSVRPGESERLVHARLSARAIELGVDSIHGILQASSNPLLYGGESNVRLSAGDIVRTDYVAYVNEYSANLSRLLSIGRPSPSVIGKYAVYLDIYKNAVELLRPGAVGGEIHRAIRALFEKRGWEAGPPISGHGIGIWFHQQRPLLVESSTDVLQPGMVVAIEPISGYWHLQDEYLITEGAPERISNSFDIEVLPWTD
jgi:Xaa-Pro aminopeptidase